MGDINAHIGLSLGFLFSLIGSSYATVKAAKFINMDFKRFIPIIMAGVLAIYGFIVILIGATKLEDIDSNRILSAGLVVGFSNMFSGFTMGAICDKAEMYSLGLFIAMVFSEAFALYGLIISLFILSD
jgi:F0F1-type ATP synthase membrane subunit c/vacuolar-type H+-ATPase subunit K